MPKTSIINREKLETEAAQAVRDFYAAEEAALAALKRHGAEHTHETWKAAAEACMASNAAWERRCAAWKKYYKSIA